MTLSPRQYNLMRILHAARHTIEEKELSAYDMRTMASMIKRGYLVRVGDGVMASKDLKETLRAFEDTSVYRKVQRPLSHFVQQFINAKIRKQA